MRCSRKAALPHIIVFYTSSVQNQRFWTASPQGEAFYPATKKRPSKDGLFSFFIFRHFRKFQFQPFLDDVVELFKYGYGIESGKSSSFNLLQIRAEIFPYVFMSETEVVSNIVQSVAINALSRRSASEMLYDLGYGVISEYDRLTEEEREKLIGSSPAQVGSTSQNTINIARNNGSAGAAQPTE
jgi:hypothetical protein